MFLILQGIADDVQGKRLAGIDDVPCPDVEEGERERERERGRVKGESIESIINCYKEHGFVFPKVGTDSASSERFEEILRNVPDLGSHSEKRPLSLGDRNIFPPQEYPDHHLNEGFAMEESVEGMSTPNFGESCTNYGHQSDDFSTSTGTLTGPSHSLCQGLRTPNTHTHTQIHSLTPGPIRTILSTPTSDRVGLGPSIAIAPSFSPFPSSSSAVLSDDKGCDDVGGSGWSSIEDEGGGSEGGYDDDGFEDEGEDEGSQHFSDNDRSTALDNAGPVSDSHDSDSDSGDMRGEDFKEKHREIKGAVIAGHNRRLSLSEMHEVAEELSASPKGIEKGEEEGKEIVEDNEKGEGEGKGADRDQHEDEDGIDGSKVPLTHYPSALPISISDDDNSYSRSSQCSSVQSDRGHIPSISRSPRDNDSTNTIVSTSVSVPATVEHAGSGTSNTNTKIDNLDGNLGLHPTQTRHKSDMKPTSVAIADTFASPVHATDDNTHIVASSQVSTPPPPPPPPPPPMTPTEENISDNAMNTSSGRNSSISSVDTGYMVDREMREGIIISAVQAPHDSLSDFGLSSRSNSQFAGSRTFSLMNDIFSPVCSRQPTVSSGHDRIQGPSSDIEGQVRKCDSKDVDANKGRKEKEGRKQRRSGKETDSANDKDKMTWDNKDILRDLLERCAWCGVVWCGVSAIVVMRRYRHSA